MKNMKIIKIDVRIIKHLKISEFHIRITKNHKNLRNPYGNIETHENQKIYIRISKIMKIIEIHKENHENQRKFYISIQD